MGKSRAFDGCWTCRARKVKCDLAKPTCVRCAKAGIECQGFDVKLGWAGALTVRNNQLVQLPETESQDNFQRRTVKHVEFPKHMLYERHSEVLEALEKLDEHVSDGMYGVGPFMFYDSNIETHKSKQSTERHIHNGPNGKPIHKEKLERPSNGKSVGKPTHNAPNGTTHIEQARIPHTYPGESIGKPGNPGKPGKSIGKPGNAIGKSTGIPGKAIGNSTGIPGKAIENSTGIPGKAIENSTGIPDGKPIHGNPIHTGNITGKPTGYPGNPGKLTGTTNSIYTGIIPHTSPNHKIPILHPRDTPAFPYSSYPTIHSAPRMFSSGIPGSSSGSIGKRRYSQVEEKASSHSKNEHPVSQVQTTKQSTHASYEKPTISSFGSSINILNGSQVLNSESHELIQSSKWVHPQLLEYARLTIVAIKGPKYRLSEQNMLHILYPTFFPNEESDDWHAEITVADKLFQEQGGEMHIKGLFCELVRNIHADSFSFNRVQYANNYLDSAAIPYLKQILCELVCDYGQWEAKVEEPSYESLVQNIKLAIAYLSLGIAGFRIHSRSNEATSKYLSISIELRKLAIRIVNFHLDEYDSHDEILKDTINAESLQYETLLLFAIVLQIELDQRFSVCENFDLVYAIGDYIIKNKFRTAKYLSVTRFLINAFKISYTMYESTQSINLFNYEISERDKRKNYPDLVAGYDLADSALEDSKSEDESDEETAQVGRNYREVVISNNHNFEEYQPMSFTVTFDKRDVASYNKAEQLPDETPRQVSLPKVAFSGVLDTNGMYLMYGIPKSLFDIFAEVIHLTNHKNIFERGNLFPRNFPKICAEVEDRLISWRVEQHWVIGDDPFQQSVRLNVEVFQHAARVYYGRLVKGKEDAIARQADLSLSKLERLEREGVDRVRPMFWVLFVCGAEARKRDERERVERLWEGRLYRGQPNYWRAKQILVEVWKRRESDEDCGFMDIVRELGIHLCLV